MGIDAKMRVKFSAPKTEEQIFQLAIQLQTIFREDLWIWREKRRQAITKSEEGGYAIHLAGRYFDLGYERGNPLTYIAIAEWLEFKDQNCEVFYGGDNMEEDYPFGPAQRQKLKDLYFESGNMPYNGAFGNILGEPGRTCDWCKIPLHNYGGGPRGAFLKCDSCGQRWIGETEIEGDFI